MLRRLILPALILTLQVQICGAAVLMYSGNMSSAGMNQPFPSAGTGTVLVTLDTTGLTMRLQGSYSGLFGVIMQSNIQSLQSVGQVSPLGTPTAGGVNFLGVALNAGIGAGGSSGSFDRTLDLSLGTTWETLYLDANGGSPATALPVLLSQMNFGQTALLLRTNAYMSGEIRGILAPIPVPEPSMTGFCCLVCLSRWLLRRSPIFKDFRSRRAKTSCQPEGMA